VELLVPFIAPIVVAVVVVRLFFGLIKTQWPTSYYSTSDLLASKVSTTWYRYSIFRFLPVFVAAILVATSGPSDTQSVLLATAAFGVLHAITTSGYSILRSLVYSYLSVRQLLVDGTVAVGALGTAVLGGLASPLVRQYIPGLDKYIEVLLTGVVASLAIAYLGRWTTTNGSYPAAQDLLRLCPPAVVRKTVQEAARFRVDRELALAVLLAETVQRPGWIRRAESLTGGRIGLSRTHGPFQNMPSSSYTDDQSIEAAMSNLAGATLPRANGFVRSEAHLEYHLERHNASTEFREVCVDIYRLLSSEIRSTCDEVGADGTPLLRLLSVKRVGYEWRLSGDVGDEAVDVQAVVTAPQTFRVYPIVAPGSFRREWSLSISLDSETIKIWPGNATGAGEMAEERCLNPALY
jgi:hypothetical protein